MMVMRTTFIGWGQRFTTLRGNDTKIPYPIKDMILAPAVDYGVKVYTKVEHMVSQALSCFISSVPVHPR
jgi:hypothetical protein